MSTIPTNCPLCGKPVDPARWSHTSDSEVPATCSGAPACPWEYRFPYVCAHCGGHRFHDFRAQGEASRGLVITLGQVCADCGKPVAMP